MSWTDERVELLKQLWGEGKTAAEIAKELGGVTRNAVIGKAHRLKLSNRVSPIQQNDNVKATEPEQPKVVKAPRKKGGVKLADLKDRMCRWPVGDPRDPEFHFCGDHVVPGMPYCEEHARAAYQAASRSRTLQAEDFEEKETAADLDLEIKHAAAG